jgi:fatty-acyl-CoA synthase
VPEEALSQVGPLWWAPDRLPPQPGTLPLLVEQAAARHASGVAIVGPDESLTYAELAGRSRQAAAVLAELGVGPGDAVGLLAPNSAQWIVLTLAAIRRGATVHTFNTWVRPAELDYLLRASGVSVLLVVEHFADTDFVETVARLVPELALDGPLRSERYPKLRHVVSLGAAHAAGVASWSTAMGGRPLPSDDSSSEADLSSALAAPVVVYTSGSTRSPKAVPLVQRDMIDNGFAIGERMRLTPEDRVWLGSPLFWSYGIANAMVAAFSHGATLVLQERFEPAATLSLWRREQVTAAYLLPTMVDALCSSVATEVRALPHLRTGLTIGRTDEVRRAAEELGIEGICNIYGLTEVYGNCCVTDTLDALELRVECQGHPLPGVELRIVDEAGTVMPRRQQGQIEVRGRVMPGYLAGPDDDVPSPFTADGWFRTGDTGLLRDDGRLQFVGRHSEMIKTAGINVSPAEIEATLLTFPGVLEAAVVGAPDAARGEVPVAFVVSSGEVEEGAVREHCRALLSSYKVPRQVIRLDALPQTATGKLTRKALVEMLAREGHS